MRCIRCWLVVLATLMLGGATARLQALLDGDASALAGAAADRAKSSGREQQDLTPQQEVVVSAVLRPSRFLKHQSATLAVWKQSCYGGGAESFVRQTFAGERVLIETELPSGLFDWDITIPRDGLGGGDDAAKVGGDQLKRARQALANATMEAAWGVRGRREMREVDVYLLKAGDQTIPLMRKVSSGGGIAITEVNEAVRLEANNAIPARLTGPLERYTSRPVLDETGIGWHDGMPMGDEAAGAGYDFILEFEKGSIDSLRNALRRELDIELVPARRELEFVIIERVGPATRPTTQDAEPDK